VNKKTILVVDDDEAILDSVADALTGAGYRVVTAENGYAAVSAVARWNPALIILDIDTPIMAGCSFLQIYSRVPEPRAGVIAMTETDATFERAVVRCVSACIEKPLEIDDLLATVERHFASKDRPSGIRRFAFA